MSADRVRSVTDAAAETPDQTPSQLDEIRAGYAFEGGTLKLGAVVIDNEAHADAPVQIPLSVLNRHGLVAGATGTGKTKTLQLMAEQLSEQGVPVFLADLKGDLSGLATPGEGGPKITERATSVGMEWTGTAYPTEFFTLGGKGSGIAIRATITGFGPTLLSKVLGLNDTQESSLGLIFHYADKNGLALLDLKDLRAVISHLTSDEGKADLKALGGLSSATAGVILRNLITFEDQGAGDFFGEPEFDTRDLLRLAPDGKGIISCLELPQVQDRPQLFSTFLMWLLADLFHDLPEEGDLDKPKLVFFFDEAHLLFNDASKAFLQAIEQTVRLIRSKGVGRLLRHAVAQGRALRGPRAARQPRAARAARLHPRRRQGAQAGDRDVSAHGLRHGEAPDEPRHRRGRRHRALRQGRADARRVDADEGAQLADGPLAPGDDRRRHRRLDHRAAGMPPCSTASPPTRCSPSGSRRRRPALRPAPPAAPAPAPAAPAAKRQAAPKEEPGIIQQVAGSSAFKSMLRSAGTVIGREITRSIFGTRKR